MKSHENKKKPLLVYNNQQYFIMNTRYFVLNLFCKFSVILIEYFLTINHTLASSMPSLDDHTCIYVSYYIYNYLPMDI